MTNLELTADTRPGRPARRTVPACWTWTPPGEASLARVTESLRKQAQKRDPESTFPDKRTARWWLMAKWHRGRCAICGQKSAKLVDDHDHEINLFRGFLCKSCNTREGCSGDPVFDLWRERHPAIIFNIKKKQADRWNPFTGNRGVPQPPHYG